MLSSLLLILFLFDVILLFTRASITGQRQIGSILSNGDINEAAVHVTNDYSFPINATIFEEIPHQLGLREMRFKLRLKSRSNQKINYTVNPVDRGEYDFGNTIVMAQSPIRLASRKYTLITNQKIQVYPSYIHMRKYDLSNFKRFRMDSGHRLTRKIGHSTEFEQIKNYVKGDDIRYINWKASAKTNRLMVNQYTEERSQQVYCVIDAGRAMKMPFDGLTLLDYAINATLAISNVIIRNHDRAGVLYFNKKVEHILKADKNVSQMPKILNLLYNIKTEYVESNFEKLYATLKFKVTHRSLILLFSNFEDMNSLQRQMKYLKSIARNNVLVLVFFENQEIEQVIAQPSATVRDYFDKSIGEKLSYQKRLMVRELNKHGIQTILTDPKNLSLDVINKYLEIKKRSLL